MSLAFVGEKAGGGRAPAARRAVTRRGLLAGAAGTGRPFGGGNRRLCGSDRAAALVVTPYTLKPRGWPAGRKLSITVIADLHAGGPDMPLPNVRGSSIPPTR